MAIYLLTGHALVQGPLFRVPPALLEHLPPLVPIHLGASLGPTPPQVPTPEGPTDRAVLSDIWTLGSGPIAYIPLALDLAATLRQLDAAWEGLPGFSGSDHMEMQPKVATRVNQVFSSVQNPPLKVEHVVLSPPTLTFEELTLYTLESYLDDCTWWDQNVTPLTCRKKHQQLPLIF